MLGKEFINNPSYIGGMKAFAFELYIVPVEECGDD